VEIERAHSCWENTNCQIICHSKLLCPRPHSCLIHISNDLQLIVIDLLLGMPPVQKHSEKASLPRQFLLWGSYSRRKFCFPSFSLTFLGNFVHISGPSEPITLVWILLERSFPIGELEYRWCQFWSKVITETKVNARHCRHGSQPRSQGPLSSYLEKVPWLRLVTCLLDFADSRDVIEGRG